MGDDRYAPVRGIAAGWMFCVSLLLMIPSVGVAVEAVEVGDHAPDFRLPSTRAHPVGLSQFLGKKHIVLQFYIQDRTPT